MDICAGPPNPQRYLPSSHVLIELNTILIEMKTIRMSRNHHKKSQLPISNRNITRNVSIISITPRSGR